MIYFFEESNSYLICENDNISKIKFEEKSVDVPYGIKIVDDLSNILTMLVKIISNKKPTDNVWYKAFYIKKSRKVKK